MSNGQSTLENVYSYSFTANNLFQISLVRDNDPNRPSYKRQHFCFLTLAPGQKTDTGRTYNFTNKINMKQDLHNILSLAHALRFVARGQKDFIGNFSLFTDSSKSAHGQGGVKQVFVNEYIQNPKSNQQNQQNPKPLRYVSLGFRIGNNKPTGIMFGIPDCLACADVIEFIAKLGLKLEVGGSTASFKKPPQEQPQKNQDRSVPPDSPPSGPPMGPPMGGAEGYNSPDSVADNFAQGLNSAAGLGDDDIPF